MQVGINWKWMLLDEFLFPLASESVLSGNFSISESAVKSPLVATLESMCCMTININNS